MTIKIQELENLRATIAEYAERGLHDKARELSESLPALEAEAEVERRAIRAHISPIAALADAVTAAPPAQTVFQEGSLTPERRAYRAGLSALLAQADALRAQQIRERGGR